MTIQRAPRPEYGFLILNNDISNDKRLSWAARGLLIYLLSKPDDWRVSVQNLINETSESGAPLGRDGVYTILRQLEEAGYLRRTKANDNGGKFAGTDYTVTESPLTAQPYTAEPYTAKPTLQRTNTKPRTEIIQITDNPPINPPLVGEIVTPFDDFWRAYPNKVAKPLARKSFEKHVKAGVRPEAIMDGLEAAKARWTDPKYIPHPSTWLNQERWNDEPISQIQPRNNPNRSADHWLKAIKDFEQRKH